MGYSLAAQSPGSIIFIIIELPFVSSVFSVDLTDSAALFFSFDRMIRALGRAATASAPLLLY